jgi:hypothetical protein
LGTYEFAAWYHELLRKKALSDERSLYDIHEYIHDLQEEIAKDP